MRRSFSWKKFWPRWSLEQQQVDGHAAYALSFW
jgi:hypothetical protein